MYDVFISYRRKTGSMFASVLEKFLEEEQGYEDVFFDKKSLREGPFDQHIDEAIDTSIYFLLVLTKGDLDNCLLHPENDWILHEVSRAFERGKIIIPLLFSDDFVFPDAPKGSVLDKLKYQNGIAIKSGEGIEVLEEKLPGFMKEHPAKALAKEYAKGILEKDFLAWQIASLKAIYGADFPLLQELGQESPAFCLAASPEIIFPFEGLSSNGAILPLEKTLPFEESPFYADFRKINGPNIHYPDLYGYTNQGFVYDASGKVKGLKVRPRTYKETVYTCHILQYEMYRLYQEYGKDKILSLDQCPLRKKIHQGYSMKDVVINGANRSALHDVIVAVMVPNPNSGEYEIAGANRSFDVATYPGYYDFIPAGGFELYELENRQSWDTVQKNFSVVSALYREFSEELFDDESFGKATGDDDFNRLFKCPEVRSLIGLIRERKAQFVFLGVVFDLLTLRQTLCFALRVDDPEYYYQNFHKNSESDTLNFDPLKDFEKKFSGNLKIVPEAIGTWHLLKETPLYQEVAKNQFKILGKH